MWHQTPTTPTPDATAVVVTTRNDAGESQLTLKARVNVAETLVALSAAIWGLGGLPDRGGSVAENRQRSKGVYYTSRWGVVVVLERRHSNKCRRA